MEYIQTFQCICAQNSSAFFGITFNTNFLEANVLNIGLLLYGLIYVLRKFLGSILMARQEKVLFAIRESEERLQQANLRLNESEKQLKQTQLIIDQIIQESELTAKKVRDSILEQGKADVEKLIISGKSTISTAENQVRQQIQQQITALAIKKVTGQLQDQITAAMQVKIIDNSIIKLENDI